MVPTKQMKEKKNNNQQNKKKQIHYKPNKTEKRVKYKNWHKKKSQHEIRSKNVCVVALTIGQIVYK